MITEKLKNMDKETLLAINEYINTLPCSMMYEHGCVVTIPILDLEFWKEVKEVK